MTVPVTADQPFWVGRLAAIGAADEPIPFRTLTADRLADALDRVVRQRAHREASARAAERMAAEDGAAETLEAVRRLSGASVR